MKNFEKILKNGKNFENILETSEKLWWTFEGILRKLCDDGNIMKWKETYVCKILCKL